MPQTLGVAPLPCATASTCPRSPACASGRRPCSGRSIASTVGDGIVVASWAAWRSTWPPTSGPSTTSRWSTSCSTSDASRAEELRRVERRLAHPARSGSTTFRRTLAAVTGSAPGESHPEVVLADALRRRGVPVEPQVRVIRPSSGRPARIDLAVPAAALGRRARHPPRAPHARRARRRRPAPPGPAPDRRGRSRPSPSPTCRTSSALADDLVGLYHIRRRQRRSIIRVRREGMSRSRHSDAANTRMAGNARMVRWWGLRCGGRRRRRGRA